MVEQDLRGRGIHDERVLEALLTVPRHRFASAALCEDAYADTPLPTRDGQTMSQPYIVALMTEALDVRPGARVLEIGTGSGYHTAVLAALGAEVWSIEASPQLHREAARRLAALGFRPLAWRSATAPSAGPRQRRSIASWRLGACPSPEPTCSRSSSRRSLRRPHRNAPLPADRAHRG